MNRDAWRTPPEVFAALDAEFNFQLDVAASAENALCELFIDEYTDSLQTRWYSYIARGEFSWCNPPYSDVGPWVRKVAKEAKQGIGCVMLVMADTSVGWYREAIKTAQEVRFITGGRLSFINPETGLPVNGNNKGSMLLIWHPFGRGALQVSHVDRDELLAKGRVLLSGEQAA